MKQLIERLRVLLHDAHEEGEIGGDAFHALAICAEANLPQLLDRLEKLERVAEIARYFLNEKELLMDEYYRVRNNEDEFVHFQKKERLWMDTLAALDLENK